jgi:hypothetical protein
VYGVRCRYGPCPWIKLPWECVSRIPPHITTHAHTHIWPTTQGLSPDFSLIPLLFSPIPLYVSFMPLYFSQFPLYFSQVR